MHKMHDAHKPGKRNLIGIYVRVFLVFSEREICGNEPDGSSRHNLTE